jgi:hypothetical protein
MVLLEVGLELVDTFRLTLENGFHLLSFSGEMYYWLMVTV